MLRPRECFNQKVCRLAQEEIINIDVHGHFTPRSCLTTGEGNNRPNMPTLVADTQGQENIVMGGYRTPAASLSDPETRIKEMAASGIDFQILSSSPRFLFYDREIEDALWFSQQQNDGIADTVKEYPERFSGMAAIPLQEPKKALGELDRAINKLGLKGVEILSHVNDRQLDDPELLPFYKEVEAMDVPVFIHPRGTRSEGMRSYHLGNLVGHPSNTTLAAAHLIFGGILEKFPNIKFCLAHGGGFLPYIRGRWEHGYEVRADCKEIIKRPPSDYISLLYFDTITHSVPVLEFLVASMGADRVMLGTDFPYDMGDLQPVSKVEGLTGISEEDRQKILGGNAARIFNL
ncbi:amidohydrolase family protein [Chloroflexota bacterium]